MGWLHQVALLGTRGLWASTLLSCEVIPIVFRRCVVARQELLVQCGHYSERVRRDGLGGLGDLLARHPPELRRHAGPIVERLAERVADPSAGAPLAVTQPQTTLYVQPDTGRPRRRTCCRADMSSASMNLCRT